MEFNQKLQQLRKSRSMTQEELAEALFVSRTAVSKWESGRGYPSVDSLREISRFFSVTVDELICPEEIITAAETEKKTLAGKIVSLVCGALDILPAVLLFIPAFRNGADAPSAVPLFSLAGAGAWLKAVFAAVIGLTVLNGISGVIVSYFDKPVWNRHRLFTGIGLSIIGVAVFIAARQPYAGILCFALLVIKGFLVLKIG